MSRGNAKMLEGEVLGKAGEAEAIGDMAVLIYKLLISLLLATARSASLPVMSDSDTLSRGVGESDEYDMRAMSSFCGSEEENICLGKGEELSCTIGREGVGCMRRRDEREGAGRGSVG